MAFEWEDFLGLAEELCEQADGAKYENAQVRTAISRAYYAAYHAARDLLEALGRYRPPSGASVHLYVRDSFWNVSDELYHRIGVELGRLVQRRRDADYEAGAARMTRKLAMNDLERARRVVEDVGKLSRGPKVRSS